MFSPWAYNIDRVAAALLERHGWSRPDAQAFPTGRELAERYLDPLAATPEIAPRLRLGTRVVGIARTGLGKVRTRGREGAAFEIRTLDGEGNEEIGRASCRERVCQYVSIPVVAVSLKNKNNHIQNHQDKVRDSTQ